MEIIFQMPVVCTCKAEPESGIATDGIIIASMSQVTLVLEASRPLKSPYNNTISKHPYA